MRTERAYAHITAARAMAELNGNRDMADCMEVAQVALEKMIPQKPKTGPRESPRCGFCGQNLLLEYRCCPYCGCLIDWKGVGL